MKNTPSTSRAVTSPAVIGPDLPQVTGAKRPAADPKKASTNTTTVTKTSDQRNRFGTLGFTNKPEDSDPLLEKHLPSNEPDNSPARTSATSPGRSAASGTPEMTSSPAITESSRERNSRLWALIHNAGHLHPKRMKLIAEAMHEDDPLRPAISSLWRWTQDYTCGPCEQGKPVHPRLSRVFPPRSQLEDSSFQPGEKLHLDGTGNFCPDRPAVDGEEC